MSSTSSSDAILSRLPEDVAGRDPSWLAGLRREAATRLRERGFPTKKTEAWKFTPVRPITSVPFEPTPRQRAQEADLAWIDDHLGDDGSFRLALADGIPRLAGAGTPPEGVELTSLAQALADDPGRIEPHLGQYAGAEHFAALNAAMFEDGLVLRVRKDTRIAQPIHLVHVGTAPDQPRACHPRLLVLVEDGAEVSLVETFLVSGTEKQLTNAVGEVALGRNARLEHLRVHEGAPAGYHVSNVAVHQDRDSRYGSRVVTLGGALFRLDLDVTLDGEGAECKLDGAYHVTDNEHVDHHTFIDHARPHCASAENYRGLLDGKGHAVFDGTIRVRRDSQHTNADQVNRNLLLSDDAGINTKPHLEIDADDVKCSHGATIGALDEAQLHYLRSRGIGEPQARAMLTYAFVRQIIDPIPQEAIRRRLGEAILARLPYGDAIRELL